MSEADSSTREAFSVPADHRLVQTGYKQSGHLGQYEKWTYDQYDAAGQLVARYEEWDEVSVGAGWAQRGWRKLSPQGAVLKEHVARDTK
ncbi:hypothetical protein G3576_30215 [Roseomonas stagni]|uniref:Uncharacterized protein n=1 Tax=Falsiroseomonas algicola TaxID=2716930 RepID=A0A6M1LWM2_9PROT|nr:hypothetical protein [Falsiroseomonas algicola]NGM24303.1 hypothetical protein [Falsiroseomonas algicola]